MIAALVYRRCGRIDARAGHAAVLPVTALACALLVFGFTGRRALGADAEVRVPPSAPAQGRDPELLTPAQWRQVDQSVSRGLSWLARQQRRDGSFPTARFGEPGVTSLCVLAFLSAGHTPQDERFGSTIQRGVDFVLRSQHPDGLLSGVYPSMPMLPANPSHVANYNHAICGLMLSEVYGMSTGEQAERIKRGIEAALRFTHGQQKKRSPVAGDIGGWRYSKPWMGSECDLSITSWQLMFMRSARNAGFDVPVEWIDDALAYVRRCFDASQNRFLYGLEPMDRHASRAMDGAGILAMSLGGVHHSEAASRAGDYLLRHPFSRYNHVEAQEERFFYSAFYCSQAMFHLGGRHWEEFYPILMTTLTRNQQPAGCWHVESHSDGMWGNTYTSALAILALTPPYQLLPIFQR